MPLLIVISGPSGVGKDAVIGRMKEHSLPFHYSVTLTTRPQRDGESDGVDYYFTPEAYFLRMVERGELLEWAKVYEHWYGVPRQQIKQALDRGQDVVVKVDVQGAVTIKKLLVAAVLIILAPCAM